MFYTYNFNDSEKAMRGKSRQHVVESRQHVVDSIQGKKSLSTVYRLLSTEKKSLPTTYCILPTEKGFTLVELMITMVIFVLVIAAASQIFTGLLTQFKQQSKIAETNIEGIVGLDLLRQDLEHTGLGLPWNIPSGTTYSEASSTTICGTANPSTYNDSTSNPPRAVISGNNNCTNSSDYLVIKAVNVATNDPSSKWTELVYASSCASPYSSFATNVCKRAWSPSTEDLSSSDYVIVVSPGTTSSTERLLNANSGIFTATSLSNINSSWLPTSASDNVRIVYGLRGSGNAPQRPFNRADYYISTSNVPQRCAANTGVLLKATMDYNGGFNQWPLLDCVADMQVDYWLDADNDGNINWPPSDDISGLTAVQIRDRVKEIRVYIVAHEGQKDINYDFSMNNTREFLSTTEILGVNSRTLNFANLKNQIGNPEYKYYRWKIYTIVVKPVNLRGK